MTTATINQTVEAIIRNGNEYKVRYAVTEAKEVQYTHPVYTGNLKTSGAVAKSATLKKLSVDVKIVTREVTEIVTEAIAQALFNSGEFRLQKDNREKWVAWAVA